MTPGRTDQKEGPDRRTPRNRSRRRTVATTVALDLRRLVRDRLALFFVFVLPFILIITIGAFVGDSGGRATVAVIDDDGGAVAARLVGELSHAQGLEVDRGRDRREAERDILIGRISAAVVIPRDFSRRLEQSDATVDVLVDRTSASAELVDAALGDAIDEVGRELTVQHALVDRGVAGAEALAGSAVHDVAGSSVEVDMIGSESGVVGFTFAAGGQMILFMFVNALTAGGMFIEMRRLGILDRARAGPVDASDVLLGFGLSRFLLAVTLATIILVFAVAAYGVDWGDPLVIGPTVVLFGLVSAGASVLIGSLFDQPDASVSVGVPVALGMAALGGCMFPLFLAPQVMQIAAKILTPHAWAVEALLDSSVDGAGPGDVWIKLAVLAGWAVVLVGLARFATRRFTR